MVTRTIVHNTTMVGQSHPTLEIGLLYPGAPVTLLRGPGYPTFTGEVVRKKEGKIVSYSMGS